MTSPYTGRVSERRPLSDEDKRLLADARSARAAAEAAWKAAEAEYKATVVEVAGRAGQRDVEAETGHSTQTILRWKRELAAGE